MLAFPEMLEKELTCNADGCTTLLMETNRTITDFTLRAENVAYFRTLLKKLNKRAVKLNLPELEFRITGRTKEVRRDKSLQWHTHIDVIGESPRLVGWSIAAVIEHTPGGNIVRDATKGRLAVFKYREADPKSCDHCKTQRDRKETVVLENCEGGLVQVGKSCLKDYLGGASVEQLMWYAGFHTTLGHLSDAEEAHDYGDRAPDGAPLVEYLSWVALCIREFGWVSRTLAKERDDATATADDALIMMYDKPPRGVQKQYLKPTDISKAEKAYGWMKDKLSVPTLLNDYQHNIQVIINNDWTTCKQAGYAASIVSGYNKFLEGNARSKAVASVEVSNHAGLIGKREVFDVIVGFTQELTGGEFGSTYLVTLTTVAGEVLKWFASRNPKLEAGRRCSIKATVKKHTKYLDIKQTVVNRCVVQEA